jgi:hypothetical protein
MTEAHPGGHPTDLAHVDNCLRCSVARAKRLLGMDPAQAQFISDLLPDHLLQPFWQVTLDVVAAGLGVGDMETRQIREAEW